MEIVEYMAVRVSTFRGDLKIPFNAYVRVAGKYILFCREGDSFEGERLDRLKSKKLQKLYIQKASEQVYNEYLRENLNNAYKSSADKPIEIRSQIIHGALQAVAEDLMEDPASPEYYQVALDGAQKFKNFFFEQPDCLKSILDIPNTDFSISHHGVTTATLALAIAEDLGLHTDRALEMNALLTGSMIHDLEHNYNNVNLTVPSDQLSLPEQGVYLKHQTDGLKRIKPHPFYDPLIFELVGKHEESIDGMGPLKLVEKEMDILVQALCTANHFDHYLTYQKLPAKDALKKLLVEKIGFLSLGTMRALQNALKKRGVFS